MTIERKAAIAGVTLWVMLTFNAGLFVWNVVGGFYGLATVQSIVLVVGTAWLWVVPKVDAFLNAQLGQAIAQRRMSELGLRVMEEQTRSGRVSVSLAGEVKSGGVRMN